MAEEYPVHRAILAFDVEGFGDAHRDDMAQKAVRSAFYRVLEESFPAAGIPWDLCVSEDRGDGAIVVVPADVSKVLLLDPLLGCVFAGVAEHNRSAALAERFRLRVAIHAGEVLRDAHGLAGGDVVRACRLLDAVELKQALLRSSTHLVVIVSDTIYDGIVRHGYRRIEPAKYHPVSVTVKKDVISAWIHLYGTSMPPTFDSPTSEQGASPHQLQPASTIFVNRSRQLRILDEVASRRLVDGPALVVLVGQPGVGKTTLALRWANEVHERFPGGQLFADLARLDQPAASEAVLSGFLRAFGVRPERIPVDLAEQVRMFRDLTVERPIVMVLDNAPTAEAVRALLPGSAASVVVVTSGTWLGGLVVEGAVFVEVEPLTEQHGLELLARSVGEERLAVEMESARRLVALCGGLPLALVITGARLAMRPRWTVDRLVSDLVDEGRRLARLSIGADLSVQAVFDMSHQTLSPSAARLYRLLGLYPGSDFGVNLAAAAGGISTLEGETLVDELVGANLIQEHTTDRYQFHELLRLHARQLADSVESESARTVAYRRMLDWCLHSAAAASKAVTPYRGDLPRDLEYPPPEPLSFGDRRDALDWLERERINLYAVAKDAADRGLTGPAWQIAHAMWGLFLYRTHYQDWMQFDLLAVRIAEAGDDLFAQAEAHDRLGLLYNALARNDEALEHMRRAADGWELLNDPLRTASSKERFGFVYLDQGRTEMAIEQFRQALAGYEALGEQRNSGLALISLGRALTTANRFEAAVDALTRASTLLDTLATPDPYNHGRALLAWGTAEIGLGRFVTARSHLETALGAMRSVKSMLGEADVWKALGLLNEQSGNVPDARECYQRSLDLFEELGNPAAGELRRRLAVLASPELG